MKKALALLSGGLDSLLAAKIIKDQGIEVHGLTFKSLFFTPKKGIKAAKQLAIPYRVINFSKKHLKIVKNPEYGFGKSVNPCIDCHLLMLKEAKKLLKKEKFDFVITGEVLGQRPLSQNKQALEIIAEKSGLKGRLVRPLSAQLLSETIPEKKGWIKREKLLAIQGRQRKKQISLAKKYNLSFPQPAGGCLLTEIKFGEKLKNLMNYKPEFNQKDVEFLKLGRHFWKNNAWIILGRNQEENIQLENLSLPKDTIIQPANFPGPLGVVKDKATLKTIKLTKNLILKYSKKKITTNAPIIFFGSSKESVLVLKILIENNIPISLVITKTDKPTGRGQKLNPTPVAKFCQKQKIKLLKLEKLNQTSLNKAKKLVSGTPILAIIAVYANLIPQNWLNWLAMPINLHPSLLPKWRGAAPVIRSRQAGETISGISIFKLIKALDSGPIISQIKIKVKPNETSGSLIKRAFEIGAKKLVQIIKPIISSNQPKFWILTPQDNSKATIALKINKQEAEINWKKPKEEIVNLINAFNPWPGTFTFIKINNQKKRLKIWQAETKKGKIIPKIVQLEGKPKTDWKDLSKNKKIKDALEEKIC